MTRALWIFLACMLAALLWASQRTPGTATHGGGGAPPALGCVLPALGFGAEPLQAAVPAAMRPFRHGDFVMSPLAAFSIQARVLGREDYGHDAEAAISPTDLALGWQRMAERSVYKPLEITQAGRWYRYRWGANGPPIPLPEIVRSSANMHIVPADENVARALDQVRPDQMVRLQGWLIEARRDDGWAWRSSLTR